MVKISRRRIAREFVRTLREQPTHKSVLVRQLAAYLIDTKQTAQLDLLLQDVADELYVQEGRLSVDIQTATPASQVTKDAVTHLLTKTTGAKSVDVMAHTNPSLLGGIIVRTPRQQLDASVRRQLNHIAGGIQ
ncbi:MAG TPA: F0F1 ATP synthase subunit delta [Candidatus Saccharimonas sp.]|nr:F0F1 ATP synthase subunit delta [Candidatus Saccharimonas sp.]